MEQRYLSVSKQLVELGYKYTLNPDSLLLVEKLLGDLIETTENLRKYMKIAQDAVEERDNLKFGAEPYKCDNAKLVKECNDLHLAFLQVKEQNEKQQKELSKKITGLEREKRELINNQKKLRERVREFELEAVRKTDRQFQNQLRQSGQPRSTSVLTKSSKKDSFEISSAMALADQKIASLTKEVNKLKENQLDLTEANCDLKNKLNTREKEIQRLMAMHEGGRPAGALNNDCCYQDMNVKLLNKQDEINYLQKAKSDLEAKLKEARCKQHEAMKHALSLAERNTVLEKELRDIDEMALAVEQECNTTVKNNSQKVKRLQERMHNTMLELQRLETEVTALRRDKQCLIADLDSVKIEKRHLQTVLENTLEDKKHLTDKINKFTIIERDLNNEIDRLVKATAEQKRTLAELKGHVLSGRYDIPGRDYGMMKPCTCQCPESIPLEPLQPAVPSKKKSPSSGRKSTTRKSTDTNKKKYYDVDTIDTSRTSYKSMPPACDPEMCMKKLKEMVDEEMDKRYPNKTDSLDRLKNERDFYIREYQQLMEQCRNINSKSDETCTLLKKLNEKEGLIINLQHENEALAKEKHNLMSRLENVRDYNDDGDSMTMKSSLKRLERERDLLKADIERMEEERDSMKQRIKVASELHSSEIERYQKSIADLEGELKKYEKERHDLLQNQGSRRATITTLEDQCETLKEQLKSTQAELTHQRTIYSQLKMLHEQTDRALADSQGQLMQLEKQLANHQQKNNMQDSNANTLSKEISNLKNDMAALKQTLSEVEMDNDNLLIKLDEKTERIATLESELQQKDCKVNQLEHSLCELKNKVSSTVEEKNTKEFLLKNTTCEIQSMKNELQCALKAKETALCENRRLQEDLAACTSDCRRANGELEIAKRQIEDLKRQLQHYVAEVKRIEDLMTQKEVERSEMLDQFRNLSHEATALENNNHSLENEATQSKVQLSVALDHASDLERQLDERNCVIKTYERQISEMSCQIANFEMQIKHYKMQLERTESDLASVQDLCVKLDKQKEDLQRQLCDQEGIKMQAERDIQRYKRDSESLRKNCQKDQETVENLEHLLAENRQQVVEQRLLNEDLQSEVVRLKNQIKDLECNLCGMRNRMKVIDCKIDVKKSCDCKDGCPSGSKCVCDNASTKTLPRSVCSEPPKSCLNKGSVNRNKPDFWHDDSSSKYDKIDSPPTHCRESPVKSSIADTVNKILEKNKMKDYNYCCNKENEPDWKSFRSRSRSPTHSIISNRYCFDDDRSKSYSPRGQCSNHNVSFRQDNCACKHDDCGCRNTPFHNKY